MTFKKIHAAGPDVAAASKALRKEQLILDPKQLVTCLLLCRSDQLSAAGAEHPFGRIASIANKCFVSSDGQSLTGRLIVDLLRILFMYD
jgi:hypothetical protein